MVEGQTGSKTLLLRVVIHFMIRLRDLKKIY